MTERDWEQMARRQLERNVADVVKRMRQAADEMEREAKRNLEAAAAPERDLEFHTYPRVASRVVTELHTLLFNMRADSVMDAAVDAELARTMKAVKR